MSEPSVTRKSTSADELRALVAGLHPRSPHEVMGEAATSSLVPSTLTATAIGSVMVIVSTLLVFLFGPEPPTKSSAPVAAVATPVEPATSVSPEPSVATKTPESATDTAIEAMGIGEAKDPGTSTKPLQSRIDELLDGLE
jgi:hypothetical protein